MHSRLTVSTLVLVGSLLGAPVIAFAQSEPAQPQSAAKHATPHHKVKPSHMRAGTTTGMSTSSPAAGESGPRFFRQR
jgi:hypothetical protein